MDVSFLSPHSGHLSCLRQQDYPLPRFPFKSHLRVGSSSHHTWSLDLNSSLISLADLRSGQKVQHNRDSAWLVPVSVLGRSRMSSESCSLTSPSPIKMLYLTANPWRLGQSSQHFQGSGHCLPFFIYITGDSCFRKAAISRDKLSERNV